MSQKTHLLGYKLMLRLLVFWDTLLYIIKAYTETKVLDSRDPIS